MNMVKLVKSTKSTSHLGSLAIIKTRKPQIGEEVGLNQLMRYKAQGLEMRMVRIEYADGATVGWVHAAVTINEPSVVLLHLGETGAWSMTFERA